MKNGDFRERLFSTAAFLALVLLSGCKSWQPVMDTPESWIARENPREVRLTAATGDQMTIRRPIVVNDSIVSESARVAVGPFAPPRRGVRLSDVHGFEVPRFDAVKTAGLAAGFLAVSISWARTAGKHGGGQQSPEPPVTKFAPGFRLMWGVIP
jgi:hypothetical protein